MESAAVSNTLLSLSYSPPKINLCISGGVVYVSDLGFDFNAVCTAGLTTTLRVLSVRVFKMIVMFLEDGGRASTSTGMVKFHMSSFPCSFHDVAGVCKYIVVPVNKT